MRAICLGCGRRSLLERCKACGAVRREVSWKEVRLRRGCFRVLSASVMLLGIGVLVTSAAAGVLEHMLANEPDAAVGRWLGVLVFVVVCLWLGAVCLTAVVVEAFGKRWEVFGEDGAINGIVHTLVGRVVGGAVMHFEPVAGPSAPDVTSASVVQAGLGSVAASTLGRVRDAESVLIWAALIGVASRGVAVVCRAEMRSWAKRAPWRQRRSRGPTPTLLLRRSNGQNDGLPALESALVESLRALERNLEPKLWFELVDVLHEVPMDARGLPDSSAPTAAYRTDARTSPERCEALGQAIARFYDEIGGPGLRFDQVPSQVAMLLSIITSRS